MTWVLALLVVVLLVRRRIRRRTQLAGLDSTKPTFALAPPTRWVTSSKDHRL